MSQCETPNRRFHFFHSAILFSDHSNGKFSSIQNKFSNRTSRCARIKQHKRFMSQQIKIAKVLFLYQFGGFKMPVSNLTLTEHKTKAKTMQGGHVTVVQFTFFIHSVKSLIPNSLQNKSGSCMKQLMRSKQIGSPIQQLQWLPCFSIYRFFFS